MSSANEQFREWKEQNERESAERLEAAKAEAHASGKEPFDLELLDQLWRDNPDARDEANGQHLTREQRVSEWEHRYYVLYPRIQTNSDFIDMMKSLWLQGFLD